jgi:hypothetical protein
MTEGWRTKFGTPALLWYDMYAAIAIKRFEGNEKLNHRLQKPSHEP